ncbi:hypothetical protein SCP_1602060 [Sparassis crispa]|uniref:Uncharacterized protein n=1 Tax=Sparassis crispa TaxID=139825 RepID=A0A401H549_9APHY|nr:hypothetical protein SCP_1602060 [Sparassis crispa]GBE89544.1 hypothetical protein SCP_1602060 [Sparassis crispa]
MVSFLRVLAVLATILSPGMLVHAGKDDKPLKLYGDPPVSSKPNLQWSDQGARAPANVGHQLPKNRASVDPPVSVKPNLQWNNQGGHAQINIDHQLPKNRGSVGGHVGYEWRGADPTRPGAGAPYVGGRVVINIP